MAHYARVLFAIGSLIATTAATGVHADDNGNCLEIYQKANGEFYRKAEVDASSDGTITKYGGSALGAGAVVLAARRQYGPALFAGAMAGAAFVLNYFNGDKSQQLANERQKYTVLSSTGNDRDAALIFEAYADALDGEISTAAGDALVKELAVDLHDQPEVLKHFVGEMDRGELCADGRTKPLGTVVSELKNYDQVQVRGRF